MNALFPANDTQSAYPPADVLLSYVTVIEAAKSRMDKLLMLSREWSDAETQDYRNAEAEVAEARVAIADAYGLTSGGLKRLVEVLGQ